MLACGMSAAAVSQDRRLLSDERALLPDGASARDPGGRSGV